MKVESIIYNYCRLYGVEPPEINPAKTQYFVTISREGAGVLYLLHKPSKLLGQIVGSNMKRGTVLYVSNDIVNPVTWDNWKQMWNRFFAPKVRENLPTPNVFHPFKSKIFETMHQSEIYRKPKKDGFERTYRANKSLNLL